MLVLLLVVMELVLSRARPATSARQDLVDLLWPRWPRDGPDDHALRLDQLHFDSVLVALSHLGIVSVRCGAIRSADRRDL